MKTNYSLTEAVEAFIDNQRADFTRTQVERMVRQAERNGATRDDGDGYNIVRTDDGYNVQVSGRWL